MVERRGHPVWAVEPKGWPRDGQPGQPGHPGWAFLIVVLTGMCLIVAGGVAWMFIDPGFFVFQSCYGCPPPPEPKASHVAALALGLTALAAAGLWWAWRVGSGHWGLRRRPTDPPPPA
jgi:hypothetical protein